MGRRGQVFAERYHLHVLRTPREVRRALAYVSGNTAKHRAQAGLALPSSFRDPFTFGYFGVRIVLPSSGPALVAEPKTWLLAHGWRVGSAPAGCVSDVPLRAVSSARAPAEAAILPLFARPAPVSRLAHAPAASAKTEAA